MNLPRQAYLGMCIPGYWLLATGANKRELLRDGEAIIHLNKRPVQPSPEVSRSSQVHLIWADDAPSQADTPAAAR